MVKTKDQIIAEGYPEGWATQCKYCGSWDCHEYADCIQCFSCKKRIKKEDDGTNK